MSDRPVGAPWVMRVLESRSQWAMLLAGLLGALLLAVATRPVMHHPPMYDELLHVLSAQGVVATGEPVILQGTYARGELFTRLVARVFEWRGESLWAARLPALLSGLALMILTGAWVTRHAGLLAGTTAAALLSASASSIELSAFARFYTLHALAMLVVYVAAFEACVPGRSWRTRSLWSLAALAIVPIAWHLQMTTLIGVGSAVAGVVALTAFNYRDALAKDLRRRPVLYALGLIGVAAVVIGLAWSLGFHKLAAQAPLWAANRSRDIGYYNRMLGSEWPLFWPLFPLASVAAIAAFRRFGLFCVVVTLAVIGVHSISAAKSLRYVYYVLPIASAVVGCGVAFGVKLLAGWIGRSDRSGRAGWPVFAATVLVVAMAANSQESRLAARFLVGKASWTDLGMFASESDWDAAVPVLRANSEGDSTIIVSSGFKGAYYLGDYDYELNASAVLESRTAAEFGRDGRTGRLLIGSRESLARVLRDSESALIIVDDDKLGSATGVSDDVVALINTKCRALEVPIESHVHAWTCRRD